MRTLKQTVIAMEPGDSLEVRLGTITVNLQSKARDSRPDRWHGPNIDRVCVSELQGTLRAIHGLPDSTEEPVFDGLQMVEVTRGADSLDGAAAYGTASHDVAISE